MPAITEEKKKKSLDVRDALNASEKKKRNHRPRIPKREENKVEKMLPLT